MEHRIPTSSSPDKSGRGMRTRAVHSGQAPDPWTGALATPIYQTSGFAYGSFQRGADIFSGDTQGYLYTRFANPTVAALEQKLSDLEGAASAVAVSSGMAAVSALTLGLLSPGDEILFVGPLYGGTEALMRQFLAKFGITATSAADRPLTEAISASTRMIWVESPTNPLLGVHDIEDLARTARAHGIWSVADNTFATPYLTQPLQLGCDFVIHSATKYIGGHGDAVGGVVLGPAEPMRVVRDTALKFLGACLGPAEATLFLRGLKTLPARMDLHCDGAEVVAAVLAEADGVSAVHYPGLPGHPQHQLAAKQMRRFGGIVSFRLHGGAAAAATFLDGLRLFHQAVSVGDVDSLACHPATTLHSSIGEEARRRNGISPDLVRLSIGIEDPHDLVADINQALALLHARAVAP